MTRTERTVAITVIAAMIALEIILNRFVSINTEAVRIGIDFLPIIIVAMLYGPIWAAAAYAIGDTIGALLFPFGPINPGITLTLAIIGLVYGLFLYGHDLSVRRLVINAIIASFICAVPVKLFLTTFFLSLAYGTPYTVLLISRIPTCTIFLAMQIVLIPLAYKLIVRKLPIYRAGSSSV